ncbi:MAG: desulfoferrodoxin [Eubacterium sp.]|nr:desulfoferrodoxin [Eubacterium sp.]
MELKFYICERCGNIVTKVDDKGTPLMCCGQAMTEIVPGTVDAAVEKHVPAYEVADGVVKVSVGEVEHPMMEAHYIMWIAVATNQGFQIKYLKPEEAPKAEFALAAGEEVDAVYAYCNLHGLWKK